MRTLNNTDIEGRTAPPERGHQTMPPANRIAVDPAILGGQPHIRGTRLTVRRIVEALIIHRSCVQLLAQHPDLDPEDVRAAAEFAACHFGPAR